MRYIDNGNGLAYDMDKPYACNQNSRVHLFLVHLLGSLVMRGLLKVFARVITE